MLTTFNFYLPFRSISEELGSAVITPNVNEEYKAIENDLDGRVELACLNNADEPVKLTGAIDEVFSMNNNETSYSKVPSDEQSDMSEEFSINEAAHVDRESNNSKDQSDAPSNNSEENSVNEVIFVRSIGSNSKDQTDGRCEETTNDGSGADDHNKNGNSVCEEIEVKDQSLQWMELDNSSGKKHKNV